MLARYLHLSLLNYFSQNILLCKYLFRSTWSTTSAGPHQRIISWLRLWWRRTLRKSSSLAKYVYLSHSHSHRHTVLSLIHSFWLTHPLPFSLSPLHVLSLSLSLSYALTFTYFCIHNPLSLLHLFSLSHLHPYFLYLVHPH